MSDNVLNLIPNTFLIGGNRVQLLVGLTTYNN